MSEIPNKTGEPNFVPGPEKPLYTPPGTIWVAIRGRDPTKNPRTISGWESHPIPSGPRQRGNYTADVDAEEMEKQEEKTEATIREARGLPPED